MNKNIGIMVAVVVVIGIGAFAITNKEVGEIIENNITPAPVLNQETSETVKVANPASIGSYEIYSPEKLAYADSGDVILFFHATWCPSCRALDADINKNLSNIPAGVVILKTDYDKEVDLKKKYGVTYQHTLVQVDSQGNMLKKWSGDSKLTKLLSQIQ
jgi:thioredoxin 1